MNQKAAPNIPLITVGMLLVGAVTWLFGKPGFYAAFVSAAGVLLFVTSLRADIRHDMAVRAVLIAFYMPVVAWLVPYVWLLYGVMIFWVPLVAGRIDRVAGIYLFSLLLLPPLDMPVEVGSLKLVDFGIHDALALGASFTILRSPDRARIARGDDIRVGFLLLIFIAAASRDTSATHFLRSAMNVVLDFGLPYYILSRSIRHTGDMFTAMRWFACGGLALASILTFEVMRRWPIYNELYWRHNVPMELLVKTRGALLRAGGPFNEPTSIALVVALCLVALWLLRDDFRTRARYRLLCLAAFLGVSAPQSRNAWVALVIAVVLADAFRGRWNALVRKLVPAAMGITVILAVASVWQDFSDSIGLSGNASDSADYRRNLLRRGTEEFWNSPLIGYSNGQLEVRLADMRQGEGIIDYVNTYLWFALAAGIIGLLIFLWNLAAPLMMTWRTKRSTHGTPASIPAAFAFASLATLGITLFFTSFGGRVAMIAFAYMGFVAAIRGAWRVPSALLRAPAPPPRPLEEALAA